MAAAIKFSAYKINLTPTLIIPVMAIIHLCLLWPGALSPDSQAQYAMAVSGIYSDHHPPLMSFVWRYLDKIWEGSGMMLLLHLSLLYGAVFYLMKSLRNLSYGWLLIFLPLAPQILIYAHKIWKDVGFAFTFLFVASYLAYLTAIKQKPSVPQALGLLTVLIYGTAIKFQAQYCAPILLGWLSYLVAGSKIYSKKFIQCFCLLSLLAYSLLIFINNILIENVQKNHSWQYVKLYDLAAISVSLNKPLFPLFTKNNNFTMENLSERFNHKSVDDLVFTDAILKIGANEEERQTLYSTWFNAVWQHPISYLKHRTFNMAYILLSCPGFDIIVKTIEKIADPQTLSYKALCGAARVISYLTLAHLLPTLLSFVYFLFGILCLRTSWAAIPLICFNGVGLMMILVLFFCSMAGTPRYTYITVCMFHASHLFAYLCYKQSPALQRIFSRFLQRGRQTKLVPQ